MTKKIIESTTFDNILGFLWSEFVLGGCTYLVFWKDASGWWYLLALCLMSASVYHRKEVIED